MSATGAGAPRSAARWIGRSLAAIGVWHTLFGLWWFAAPLGETVRAGLWNAVGWTTDPRAHAFWFLATGAFALLTGHLADRIEATHGALPRAFGWGLVAIALAGGAIVPVSGFWLLLLPGIGALRAGGYRRVAAG